MNLLFISGLLSTPRVPPYVACVGDEASCFAEVAKEAINAALIETFAARIDEIIISDSASVRTCIHKDKDGTYWHFHESQMKYLDPDTVEWIPIVRE